MLKESYCYLSFIILNTLSALEVEIKNKELATLYETGKSKKYKIPSLVADKFLTRILQIESAYHINDLKKTKFLHFKKTTSNGDVYSLDVESSYKLIVEIEWLDTTKGKFLIIDLVNG